MQIGLSCTVKTPYFLGEGFSFSLNSGVNIYEVHGLIPDLISGISPPTGSDTELFPPGSREPHDCGCYESPWNVHSTVLCSSKRATIKTCIPSLRLQVGLPQEILGSR